MRTITIGECTLICGDALEALLGLAGQADLIVCDPPYELTSGGGGEPQQEGSIRMRGCFDAGAYDNGGNLFADVGEIPDWTEFMPLFFAALRDPAHCYVMANNRNVQPMLNAAEAAGLYFHNLLRWRKGTYTPNRWYMKGGEYTGFFSKGKAFNINDCSSPDEVYVPQVDETKHPTEKPVALMRHYIENSSQPGQVVLDPFMGSGTTGVAAVLAGRRFIGVEKSEKWFDVACARIRAAYDVPIQKPLL